MKTRLTLLGFHMPRDGYGYGTMRIAEQLKRIDPTIEIVDMRNDAGKFGVPGDRIWNVDGTAIALCTPDWLPAIRADRLLSYTMFEATRLPNGWVDLVNTYASQVIVPCQWNADVFKANGVMPAVQVAKWGIDPHDYYPLERIHEENEPYTFLWSGTPDRRKGWDVAYRAFWNAFKGDARARLIMHFRAMPSGVDGCQDANVEIVSGLLDVAQQRDLLQRADCYVFPSRGEGWGSPPREAAATGLPVIATNWSGLAEDIADWAIPLNVMGMSQAEYGFPEWGDIGQWAEPDMLELAAHMRLLASHFTRGQTLGRIAAEWLAENATWEHTVRRLIEIVEQMK